MIACAYRKYRNNICIWPHSGSSLGIPMSLHPDAVQPSSLGADCGGGRLEGLPGLIGFLGAAGVAPHALGARSGRSTQSIGGVGHSFFQRNSICWLCLLVLKHVKTKKWFQAGQAPFPPNHVCNRMYIYIMYTSRFEATLSLVFFFSLCAPDTGIVFFE